MRAYCGQTRKMELVRRLELAGIGECTVLSRLVRTELSSTTNLNRSNIVGKKTGIAWCDGTFNPWWGCVKVSPACTNCYAATFDKRVGGEHWGPDSERRTFGDKHWNEPLKWNAAAEREGIRKRVFCASMADVFEGRPDLDEHRARLWQLIDETPNIDWLLLTKRPENIAKMIAWDVPKPNVWLGTTVENQKYANERIPHLVAVPAVVHFLSCEPQLGHIEVPAGIEWVISGCESGPKSRTSETAWYRTLRDSSAKRGAAFFLKQARLGTDGITPGKCSWIKGGDIVEQPYLDKVQHIAHPFSAKMPKPAKPKDSMLSALR